ncbi:copper chaperone PCu(A)C [Nocardiopsis sp. JB363]|uniref:copper chaperone PCu(A)C n=1 Tax=Nocardiopsis sp. JB363 TaxID=1434837 RepID=UPI001F307902|nr:copper chaperone PCu(A)C [Nocardiopsis sp. JB363]
MKGTPMRNPRRSTLAALLLCSALVACGTTDDPGEAEPAEAVAEPGGQARVGELMVEDAWMPEPANPEVGAVYLAVTNSASADDAVVGVRTSASPEAGLHRGESTEEGASTMRPVEEVPVPAGGTTTFVQGGYHVMVEDIPDPLRVGDEVTVTLDFASGVEARLEVPVREMTGGSDQDDHSEGHGHH